MKNFLILISLISFIVISIVIKSFDAFELDLSKLYRNETSTTVYDSEGRLLFSIGVEKLRPIKLEQLEDRVINTFIGAEDKDFFNHSGFNIKSIFRAFLANVEKGSITQGGSTISQQLIKLKYLNNEKTLIRKIKELFLTLKLEQALDKKKILEIYLNAIFLGKRNIGIGAAADFYFDKNINQLTQRQLAFLAVMIPAPSVYSKYINGRNSSVVNKKIDNLLEKLYVSSKISKQVYDSSLKEVLQFNVEKQSVNIVLKLKIIESLTRILSKDAKSLFGYKVFTSIDSKLQQDLAKRIHKLIDSSTDSLSAVVSVRPSGRIAAYAGFINQKEYYDIISGGRRSIDSLVLPFIYAFALEKGFHLSSDIYRPEKKLTLKIKKGGLSIYSAFARNYTHENMRLVYKLGVESLSNYMENFNLGFNDESKLISGDLTTSLMNLSSAYNSINNDGLKVNLSVIDSIVDNNSRQVYKRKSFSRRVTSQKNNYLIKSLILSKSKSAPYCSKVDDLYDYICVDLHKNLTTVSWVGSIERTKRVSQSQIEGLNTISFKKTDLLKPSGIAYFLLREDSGDSFVPHFL